MQQGRPFLLMSTCSRPLLTESKFVKNLQCLSLLLHRFLPLIFFRADGKRWLPTSCLPETSKCALPTIRPSHSSSLYAGRFPPIIRLGRKRSTATPSEAAVDPFDDNLNFRSSRLAWLTKSSWASFANPAQIQEGFNWSSSQRKLLQSTTSRIFSKPNNGPDRQLKGRDWSEGRSSLYCGPMDGGRDAAYFLRSEALGRKWVLVMLFRLPVSCWTRLHFVPSALVNHSAAREACSEVICREKRSSGGNDSFLHQSASVLWMLSC